MDRADVAFEKIKSHILALQVIACEENLDKISVIIGNDGYFDVDVYPTGDVKGTFFKVEEPSAYWDYLKLKNGEPVKSMEGLYEGF